MEIPAWLFFAFWAVISITFLHLGFYALDKTELSSSVSPVVMSVFKHSLAISSCCSSCSALILRPRSIDHILTLYWVGYLIYIILCLKYIIAFWKILCPLALLMYIFGWLFYFSPKFNTFVIWFFACLLYFAFENSFFAWLVYFTSSMIFWWLLLRILITTVISDPTDSVFPWLIPILALINLVEIIFSANLTPQQRASIGIHMAIETSLFFINNEITNFFPILVLFLSASISTIWTVFSPLEPYDTSLEDESSITESTPAATVLKDILSTLKGKKMLRKFIGFSVGTLGTFLFQYFFKLTSFDHVIAFLSLAVTWLANLALLGVSNDFGVFNFLLANVVVGCTVNQFGLQPTTWLAYGASLLLFGLRLKLGSFNLADGGRAVNEPSRVEL